MFLQTTKRPVGFTTFAMSNSSSSRVRFNVPSNTSGTGFYKSNSDKKNNIIFATSSSFCCGFPIARQRSTPRPHSPPPTKFVPHSKVADETISDKGFNRWLVNQAHHSPAKQQQQHAVTTAQCASALETRYFTTNKTTQKYTSVCLSSTGRCISRRMSCWSRKRSAGQVQNRAASRECRCQTNALGILFY